MFEARNKFQLTWFLCVVLFVIHFVAYVFQPTLILTSRQPGAQGFSPNEMFPRFSRCPTDDSTGANFSINTRRAKTKEQFAFQMLCVDTTQITVASLIWPKLLDPQQLQSERACFDASQGVFAQLQPGSKSLSKVVVPTSKHLSCLRKKNYNWDSSNPSKKFQFFGDGLRPSGIFGSLRLSQVRPPVPQIYIYEGTGTGPRLRINQAPRSA